MENKSYIQQPPSKILIIDDEQEIIDLIRKDLKREGYQIIFAMNGKEGLELLKKEHPVLIILDIKMPVMDGIEFLNLINLRPSDPYSTIVLSGYDDEQNIKKCFDLGASYFLAKPFNLYMLIGMVKNAIESKHLQLMLQESEKKLRLHRNHLEMLVEERTKEIQTLSEFPKTNPNPFIRCKSDGEIIYINPAMERLKKEIGLEQLCNIKEILPQSREKIVDIICTNKTIINEEVYLQDKVFLLTCNSFPDEASAFIVFCDITDRKRMEENLVEARQKSEAANLAKSTFLANMGHELRTPLNAIIGFSELLQNSNKFDEKQSRHLENIHKSGEHLLYMINDILDLSGSEAGRMEFDIREVSLVNILNSMVSRIKPFASKKNVKVTISFDEDLPTIKADEVKLNKVVSNLLDNAVKFTPDGGQIKVEAVKIDDKVQISVVDTGTGIKPEDKKAIFMAFEMADNSFKRKYGGPGVGLSIAKRFVEMHGGKIWVETGVEKGSVFKFVIPIEAKPCYGEGFVGGTMLLEYSKFHEHVERILLLHKRIDNKFGLMCLKLKPGHIELDSFSFPEALKGLVRKNEILGVGKDKECYYLLLINVERESLDNAVRRVGDIVKEKGYDVNITTAIYPEDGKSTKELIEVVDHKESM